MFGAMPIDSGPKGHCREAGCGCEEQGDDSSTSKVAVVGAFVVMIVVNGITATGTFGTDIATISDRFPTYITPDGMTFAIWSVIYFGFLDLTITQYFASVQVEELLLARRCRLTDLDVRQRVCVMFLLNAVWLPLYVNLQFMLALVVIAVYLGVLISIMVDLNPTTTKGFLQYFAFSAPIAANASWLVVATSANALTAAGDAGLKDQNGVAGSPEAGQFVVVLAAVLAVFAAIWPSDPMWPAVTAWALMGVYRTQTVVDEESFPVAAMNKQLASVAMVSSVVCLAALPLAVFLMIKRIDKRGTQLLPQRPRSNEGKKTGTKAGWLIPFCVCHTREGT